MNWMNAWINEWTDGWVNEWMNAWMNDWMNELNTCSNEWNQWTYAMKELNQMKLNGLSWNELKWSDMAQKETQWLKINGHERNNDRLIWTNEQINKWME
jgi:hypothetical protein